MREGDSRLRIVPVQEYLRPSREHVCGSCAHIAKDHVQISYQKVGASASKGNVGNLEKMQVKEVIVHFQKRNGKKMEIDGLSVHLLTPKEKTVESLIGLCCTKASTSTGRLLGGPSGPEITLGAKIPKSVYFRSDEDGNCIFERSFESLLEGPAPPPRHKKLKIQSVTSVEEESVILLKETVKEEELIMMEKTLKKDEEDIPAPERKVRIGQIKEREQAIEFKEEELRKREEQLQQPSQKSSSSLQRSAAELWNVKLLHCIGSGGEASVSEGLWAQSKVAVKILKGEFDDETLSECSTLTKLSHPNVVRFFGVTSLGTGTVGLVLELCSMDLGTYAQRTPATRLTNKSEPTQSKMLQFIRDAVCGLVYAHDLGVVHLDVKPSNILIKGDCGKLADFGMAMMVSSIAQDATRAVTWPGTQQYRAPELYECQKPPTRAADVWSIAITLLEIMSGTRPYGKEMFKGVGPVGTPKHVKGLILPPALNLVGKANREDIYYPCLTFNPVDRVTAEQLHQLLAKYTITD